MKAAFIFIVILLLPSLAFTQHNSSHVAGIEGKQRNSFTRVGPPSVYTERSGLAKVSTSSIVLNPDANFPDSAKTAVQYALTIWSFLINSSQTITVDAHWTALSDNNILAEAAPTSYDKDFPSAPQSGTLYPIALVEMLSGQNRNGTTHEVDLTVNSNQSNWYYGTDGNPPAGKFDLVSIIMHEFVHGLGFIHSFGVNSGSGSWGNFPSPNNGFASVFDKGCIVGDNHGTSIYKLTNTSQYANPSRELGAELVSNNIYFDGINSYWVNSNSLPKLYAPSDWSTGSSIAHLDEGTYPAGNSNSLMTPDIGMAEAIHSPGELGLSMLEDLGWNVNRVITVTSPAALVVWGQGSTHAVTWTDNKGGAMFIELHKKNISGGYDFYSTLPYSGTSVRGSNPPWNWTISTSIPNGDYKLKMLDNVSGYGMSSPFTISNLPTVEAPQFSPAGGRYTTAQSVSITSATAGAEIHYTTNGTEPTTSSPLYNGVITVSTSTWLRARGFKSGYNPSLINDAVYTIGQGSTAVTIAHIDEGSQGFGGFSTWDYYTAWTLWSNPTTFYLDAGDDLTIYANPDYRTGTTQKFWRWEFTSAPSILYDNLIANRYYLGGQRGGYFKSALNATIQTQLLDGGQNGSVVEFKDPWLPDAYNTGYQKLQNQALAAPFKAYPSPLNPNTNSSGAGSEFKGVLLDQTPPTDQNQSKPYYSVRVLPTQDFTVNGQTKQGSFVGWSAENADLTLPYNLVNGYYESPVVFHAGTQRIVTASYKGHLLSSIATAVSGSGQHKFLSTYIGSQVLRLVYESANTSFSTYSTDNGATWSNESALDGIASTSTFYRGPTVSTYDGGSHQDAWEYVQQQSPTSLYHEIRTSFTNNPAFVNHGTIQSFTTTSDQAAIPALASAAGFYFMAWRDAGSLKYAVIWPANPNNIYISTVPGTGTGSSSPAIAARYITGDPKPYRLYIAWEEVGVGVEYADAKFDQFPADPSTLGTRILWATYGAINSIVSSQTNLHPSIVLDAFGNSFIAWEFKDTYNSLSPVSSIKVQKRTSSSPSVVSGSYEILHRFGAGFTAQAPSLTDYRYNTNGLGGQVVVTFQTNNGLVTCQYDPSLDKWSEPQLMDAQATVAGPSAVLTQSATDNTRSCTYLKSAGSGLYSVNTVTIPPASFLNLVSPANAATGLALPVSVSWSAVTGATSYEVVVSIDNSFQGYSVVSDGVVTSTSYEIPCTALGYNTTYYWRVAATLGALGQGAFTAYWTFTTGSATGTAPSSPTNLTAPSVLVGGVYYPQLNWTAPTGTIKGYQVYRYSCAYGTGDCGTGPDPLPPSLIGLTAPGVTTYTDYAVQVWTKSMGGQPTATDYYQVKAVGSTCLLSAASNKVSVSAAGSGYVEGALHTGGGGEEGGTPAQTRLSGSYPNPFNPVTNIEYALAAPGVVSLSIYNVLGEEVARLVDSETKDAGYYQVTWDGTSAASGIYFLRMSAIDNADNRSYNTVKKIVLMK
ncbi:MAG: chitobiase/beta-hexosaminidase C-terminal domain-containing protein [Ignavibacteriae bacterium]|nr:chitobiase/beta-hexosaminidase C-terminal domain-containing protein [Ignavibacteriota bacterium]